MRRIDAVGTDLDVDVTDRQALDDFARRHKPT
jgi:hypothetical protein